jgi:hypothetical protein
LNDFLVPITRCLCPFIVSDIQLLPQIDELLSDAFNEFCRWYARFRCRLLDLLSVLIDAGQKENVFAFEPMIARNHIGQHFFVSVANMRRRIGIIDRRGDEECFRHEVKLPDESL